MAVESNIKRLYGILGEFSQDIKDDVYKRAMNKVSRLSERAMEEAAIRHNVYPSYSTGLDQTRSKKEYAQNLSYGRSITDWRTAEFIKEDYTGSIVGSPSSLGHRLSYINNGTNTHVLWGRYVTDGQRARPMVDEATAEVQKYAPVIIEKALKQAIASFKPRS